MISQSRLDGGVQLSQRRPVGLDLEHAHAGTGLIEGRSEFVDLDLARFHVVGAAQCAHIDVVWGAEDSR